LMNRLKRRHLQRGVGDRVVSRHYLLVLPADAEVGDRAGREVGYGIVGLVDEAPEAWREAVSDAATGLCNVCSILALRDAAG